MKKIGIVLLIALAWNLESCQSKQEASPAREQVENEEELTDGINSKTITYTENGVTYQSYVAFKGKSDEKRPVVFVIPEWWGLNPYAKSRADQLAELGYYAMAMDFYGDGKTVDNPNDAGKLATPFYEDATKAKQVFDAGKNALKAESRADLSKAAVIGYCFGGAMALNMGRQEADLKGVASFHGNLMTGVKPQMNQVKFLVLNGEADSFVPKDEIQAFEAEMDSAQIDYKIFHYPDALHSFTNPNSTDMGKKFNMQIGYNEDADRKSWMELQNFLKTIFQ